MTNVVDFPRKQTRVPEFTRRGNITEVPKAPDTLARVAEMAMETIAFLTRESSMRHADAERRASLRDVHSRLDVTLKLLVSLVDTPEERQHAARRLAIAAEHFKNIAEGK